jgi:ribosomal protein S18 acetylase RimI-like enzyme
VVGTIKIDVQATEAEFGMFAVDPEFQSQGLGGKLLDFAQIYAKVQTGILK